MYLHPCSSIHACPRCCGSMLLLCETPLHSFYTLPGWCSCKSASPSSALGGDGDGRQMAATAALQLQLPAAVAAVLSAALEVMSTGVSIRLVQGLAIRVSTCCLFWMTTCSLADLRPMAAASFLSASPGTPLPGFGHSPRKPSQKRLQGQLVPSLLALTKRAADFLSKHRVWLVL